MKNVKVIDKAWVQEELPQRVKELELAWQDMERRAWNTAFELRNAIFLIRGYRSGGKKIPSETIDFHFLLEKILINLSEVLNEAEREFFDKFYSKIKVRDFDRRGIIQLMKFIHSNGYTKITYRNLAYLEYGILIKNAKDRELINVFLSLLIDLKDFHSIELELRENPNQKLKFTLDQYFKRARVFFNSSDVIAEYIKYVGFITGYIKAKIPGKYVNCEKKRNLGKRQIQKIVEYIKKHPEGINPDGGFTEKTWKALKKELGVKQDQIYKYKRRKEVQATISWALRLQAERENSN